MMRILRLFLLMASAAIAQADTCVSYHSKLVPSWTLVLTATAKTKAYLYSGSAVEVIDVVADGARVHPRTGGVVRLISSSYPVASDIVTYRFESDRFNVMPWKSGSISGGVLLEYPLSSEAKKIVITYKIHFPDGTESPVNTLTSYEINELGGIR